MGCIPKSKYAAFRTKKLVEAYDKWANSKVINSKTQGDKKYFRSFYEEVTKKDLDYGSLPTMKEIKK